MKRILVPSDFSKPAREAFKMAVDIAAKSNATITVLHVIYVTALYDSNFIGEPAVIGEQFFKDMENDAKKAFEEMNQKEGKGVKAQLEIAVGGLFETIKRFVDQQKIELVVMGTTGSSGFAEVLIGSNTEKTVRFSEVPVLVVRQAVPVRTMKNILLPTTGNLDEIEFISKVKDLQTLLGAKLHVLLINTPTNFMRDEEGKETLEEFVKHYHLANYELHFRSYRQEEEGIIDFTYTNKMDLIAMATHSRRGLSHLFSGSITENVVNHIQVPVWTYSIRK